MPEAFESEVEIDMVKDYVLPKVTFTKFDKSSKMFVGGFTSQQEGTTAWGILATQKRFVETGVIAVPNLTEIPGWQKQWNLSQMIDIYWRVELQSGNLSQFFTFGIPREFPDTFEHISVSTDGYISLNNTVPQVTTSSISSVDKTNPNNLLKADFPFQSDYFIKAFPK
jgi:hypothetical protein